MLRKVLSFRVQGEKKNKNFYNKKQDLWSTNLYCKKIVLPTWCRYIFLTAKTPSPSETKTKYAKEGNVKKRNISLSYTNKYIHKNPPRLLLGNIISFKIKHGLSVAEHRGIFSTEKKLDVVFR
jgi:hypothetical protein